jgi:hypothetical protein
MLLRWTHGVVIRDIPEPIIKSSYALWRCDTGSLASLRQSTPHTRHNILMAEEISQCPLAYSRRDIVDDRAGVRFLAACSIMISHDTMKLFRIVRSSKCENILSCKGSNPCSVNYNILPVDIGQPPQPTEYWEEPDYNDKMHEKCRVGLCILGHFVNYYKLARLS